MILVTLQNLNYTYTEVLESVDKLSHRERETLNKMEYGIEHNAREKGYLLEL